MEQMNEKDFIKMYKMAVEKKNMVLACRELERRIGMQPDKWQKRLHELWEAVQKRLFYTGTEQQLLQQHIGFWIFLALIRCLKIEGILRVEFFATIHSFSRYNEHIESVATALSLLTHGGKEISPFETETGEILIAWLHVEHPPSRITLVLRLAQTIVKFNFALFSEWVAQKLIDEIYHQFLRFTALLSSPSSPS